MTNDELLKLATESEARIDELEAKYRTGVRLTRKECNDLRHATARLGVVARELWIANGQPDDPEFEALRSPIKLTPLPPSLRPIDLTRFGPNEVH
jgi:hypothetical protein